MDSGKSHSRAKCIFTAISSMIIKILTEDKNYPGLNIYMMINYFSES
jgi:hypothetical protein